MERLWREGGVWRRRPSHFLTREWNRGHPCLAGAPSPPFSLCEMSSKALNLSSAAGIGAHLLCNATSYKPHEHLGSSVCVGHRHRPLGTQDALCVRRVGYTEEGVIPSPLTVLFSQPSLRGEHRCREGAGKGPGLWCCLEEAWSDPAHPEARPCAARDGGGLQPGELACHPRSPMRKMGWFPHSGKALAEAMEPVSFESSWTRDALDSGLTG